MTAPRQPRPETVTPPSRREIHRQQMRELDTKIGDLNHQLKLARAKQAYLRLLRGPMDIVEEPPVESPAESPSESPAESPAESPVPPEESV